MNSSYFHKQLVDNGSYTTPADLKRPLFYRLLGWTSFAFYCGLFRVVFHGSRVGKSGKYTSDFWSEQSVDITSVAEYCGGRISIEGTENLKGLGPVVYVANHMSMLETFMLPGILLAFNSLSVVVKESLLTYPVFGYIMSAVEPIAVSRKDPRQDLKTVMDKGLEYLKKGKSVLIFPQATRRFDFVKDDFNSLGVKLAKLAGVKVVPMALKTDFMRNGKWIKDFGRLDRSKPIYYAFGRPMDIVGNGKTQQEQAVEFISAKLKSWE